MNASPKWTGVRPHGFFVCVLAVLALGTTSASAQTSGLSTSFIYQGQLTYRGGPADGMVDFQFTLWDAASAGNQIGASFAVNTIPVVAGLFSTPIDFGAGAINGQPRWLQIGVRFTGSVDYVTLSPRQPLLAAPFALQTRGLSIDSNDVMRFTTNPNLVVATMAADPFNMAIYAPLRLNNQFTLAPEPGSGTGILILQPDDALFIPLKLRPAAYGTEDPPMRDFNLVISDPTDSGGTRKNRVITFGYNNNGDGFPESPDAYALCDRWETNWVINGHNHFERHIQYVSINPGPNYMKMFRPLSIFIDKDEDRILTDLSADAISINNADGSIQYFQFLGLGLQCLNGSRIVFPNAGSKTLISALGTEGFFGDVIGMDASDRIILGSPNIAGGTLVTGGDLTVDQGNLNVSSGSATVKNGVTVTDGDLTLQGSGHGLRMTEGGSDARIGVVTLVNGTAVVNTTGVTANSRIFLTSQQDGNGQAGAMRVASRIPGSSFTISSSRTNDTATVAWMIIEPN